LTTIAAWLLLPTRVQDGPGSLANGGNDCEFVNIYRLL